MKYGILGPVGILNDGAWANVGRPRERRVFAVLLLHANRVVSVDRLVNALWADLPPATVDTQIRNAIAALRRGLRAQTGQPAPISRVSGGLRMMVGEGELDLHIFESRVEQAQQLIDTARFGPAADLLREALALWRGPALSGIDAPVLDGYACRLEEQRLACLEQRIELDLVLGRQRGVVGELRALVGEYPLRERLVELGMIALHLCGRRQDALDAFTAARHHLSEYAGLDPRPELRELQQAILRGGPLPEHVWGVPSALRRRPSGPAGLPGPLTGEAPDRGRTRLPLEREAERLRAENELLRAELDSLRSGGGPGQRPFDRGTWGLRSG